jgi:hypothetical protein
MSVLESRIKEDHEHVLELVAHLYRGVDTGPKGSSTHANPPTKRPRRVGQARPVAVSTAGKSEIATGSGAAPADGPSAQERAGAERTSGWKANLVVAAVTAAVILVVLLVLGAL